MLTAQVQTNTTTNALHVCHTSCDLYDAGTLNSWLSEVNTWLTSNPNEVVTILLVNGADASASDLAAQYQQAGIGDIVYTPTASSSSSSSSDYEWPTLQSLINNGTRLLNFVGTLSDNSGASYLMNEFDYIFENSYENAAPTDFSCIANRPSSVANNTDLALSKGLMPLMNHFLYEDEAFGIQAPNDTYATTTNAPNGGSGNLGSSADECTSSYGKAPQYILVDFFNLGPAMTTVDRLNGVTDAVGRTTVSSSSSSSSQTTSGVSSTVLRTGMLWFTVLASLSAFA